MILLTAVWMISVCMVPVAITMDKSVTVHHLLLVATVKSSVPMATLERDVNRK